MKVVLLDDIVNLGDAGEVVAVKNGFARNWLIPKGLAELATRDSVNRVGLIKRAAEAKRVKRMTEAADKFGVLTDKTLTISMKAGTEGRIFGAVTSAMIADEVQKQFGVTLERRHVMLEEPIKQLGEFTVPLRAGAATTGEIKLVVEAELKPGQLRGGDSRPMGPTVHFDEDDRPRRGRRPRDDEESGYGGGGGSEASAEPTAEAAPEAPAVENDEKYEDIAEQAEEQV